MSFFFGRVSNDPGTRRKRRKWNKRLNVDTVAKLLVTMVNLTYNLCSHQARGTTFDQQLQLLCILFPLLTQSHPQKVKNTPKILSLEMPFLQRTLIQLPGWTVPVRKSIVVFSFSLRLVIWVILWQSTRGMKRKGLFGLLCLEVCGRLYENGSHRPPYLDAWYIVHGYFGRIRKYGLVGIRNGVEVSKAHAILD